MVFEGAVSTSYGVEHCLPLNSLPARVRDRVRQAREARFGNASTEVYIGGGDYAAADGADELTPEEQERRAARASRFGGDGAGEGEEDGDGMELDSSAKRREVPHDVKVSP